MTTIAWDGRYLVSDKQSTGVLPPASTSYKPRHSVSTGVVCVQCGGRKYARAVDKCFVFKPGALIYKDEEIVAATATGASNVIDEIASLITDGWNWFELANIDPARTKRLLEQGTEGTCRFLLIGKVNTYEIQTGATETTAMVKDVVVRPKSEFVMLGAGANTKRVFSDISFTALEALAFSLEYDESTGMGFTSYDTETGEKIDVTFDPPLNKDHPTLNAAYVSVYQKIAKHAQAKAQSKKKGKPLEA